MMKEVQQEMWKPKFKVIQCPVPHFSDALASAYEEGFQPAGQSGLQTHLYLVEDQPWIVTAMVRWEKAQP